MLRVTKKQYDAVVDKEVEVEVMAEVGATGDVIRWQPVCVHEHAVGLLLGPHTIENLPH